MIPVFINGVFFQTAPDAGESRHITFIDYGNVVCKRIRFMLNNHKSSVFAGEMPDKDFERYEQA